MFNFRFPLRKVSLRQNLRRYRLMGVAVVFPTALGVFYFGVIAADVYISEARFVVRAPERSTVSSSSLFMKSVGFSYSQEDSYIVHDFIFSRDALRALDNQLNLRSVFSRGDVFSRFPGLYMNNSFESMYRYYQKMVSVRFDPLSSITTLKVRAFRPQEAQAINHLLLEMSEALINKLNERAGQDMIRFAETQVAQAEEKAMKAALALAAYRNQMGVIDPEKQYEIPLQRIAKLQDELIATKTQLSQLQLYARDNPQIPVLRQRVQILEKEIERESVKVAGDKQSFATIATEFQRLSLEKEFADKQFASALASLEQARSEVQRKQLYLERITQASLPDAAVEPRRLRNIITIFIIAMIVWGILELFIAAVREHLE